MSHYLFHENSKERSHALPRHRQLQYCHSHSRVLGVQSKPHTTQTLETSSSVNGTPLCSSRCGSYTLEAAIVLPLVAAFLAFFLFFFRVMQVEYRVQEALIYTGRQTAATNSAANTVSRTMANVYFKAAITDDDLISEFVQNGTSGIVLTISSEDENYLYLRATYRVKFPIGFFSFNGIGMTAESKNRVWTGSSLAADASDDPIVYYTQYGSVYHTTQSCSYIDLTIQMCSASEVSSKRNKSGSRYTACSKCAAGTSGNGIVYITDYGTTYHTSISCSGLKRTIYTAKLSEVNLKACSKCGGT